MIKLLKQINIHEVSKKWQKQNLKQNQRQRKNLLKKLVMFVNIAN